MTQTQTAFDYTGAIQLDGKGFVVLGASGGGMGTQTSLALSQAGADLLLVDVNPAQADEIAAATGGAPHVCDINDRGAMEALFARAQERFGDRFAGVVDIVGMARAAPLPDFDDAQLDAQISIVLRHALLATQIAGPILAANGGGAMTFVGSISGVSSVAGQAVYGTAKAALHHLVRCAAHEYAPAGVRVNAVAPGFVRTPRLLQAMPEETWRRLAENNPMKRVADPEDIAKAILFLSSDLASYVTGNVLTLDGGISNRIEFL